MICDLSMLAGVQGFSPSCRAPECLCLQPGANEFDAPDPASYVDMGRQLECPTAWPNPRVDTSIPRHTRFIYVVS